MDKVKHLDATHKDTNIQVKINNMRHKHERDTEVRGSPNPWGMSTKRSHCVTFISLRNYAIQMLSYIFLSYSWSPPWGAFLSYSHAIHTSRELFAIKNKV